MPTLRLTPERIDEAAQHRAPGFAEAVRRLAEHDGTHYHLELKVWHQLTLDHLPNRPPLAGEPSAVDLATRAAFAAWRAARAAAHGAAVLVDADTYAARTSACTACTYWDGSSRLGLGTCNHHGCGCTKLKRWLATERCPAGRWAS